MSARWWFGQVLACGVSVALICLSVGSALHAVREPTPSKVRAPAALLPPPQLSARVVALEAALARPLFREDRRPYELPMAAAADPSPAVEPMAALELPTLRGILLAGGRHRALLSHENEPDGEWIGLGETFVGWHLIEVRADSVEVSTGQRQLRLVLRPEETAPAEPGSADPVFPWLVPSDQEPSQ